MGTQTATATSKFASLCCRFAVAPSDDDGSSNVKKLAFEGYSSVPSMLNGVARGGRKRVFVERPLSYNMGMAHVVDGSFSANENFVCVTLCGAAYGACLAATVSTVNPRHHEQQTGRATSNKAHKPSPKQVGGGGGNVGGLCVHDETSEPACNGTRLESSKS